MALQYFGRSAKSILNGAGGAYMPTTILLALLKFELELNFWGEKMELPLFKVVARALKP